MKKIWIYILTVVTSVCMVLGVACTSKAKEVKIVGFDNKTYELPYGSVFRAQDVATDENGNEYDTVVIVTDSDGDNVEVVNKQFTLLDKDGYTVKYKADVNGKTYSKTDTVNVVANNAPVVTIDGIVSAFIIGGTYQVPAVSALDYYDGNLTAVTEIYKVAANGDVKCEYDGNGEFTPTETGTYYVKATATNSAKMQTEASLHFYVRAAANDGEWDSFDDAGCVYTSVENSMISGKEWLETFEGRTGVMAVKFNENDAYSAALRILPKSDDKDRIENYSYLVVSAYVEGKEGSFFNYHFCSPNATSLPMIDVKYNAWNTFVFPASGVLNNWDSVFVSTSDSSNAYMIGAILEDCTVYFDNVYFANEVALEGTATESEDIVTLDYTAGENQIAYTVLYDGKPVKVTNNTFEALYAGEYTVYPQIINSANAVYAGEPITYQSNGVNALALNEYDEVIALDASEYTLPNVSVVDGNGEAVTGYEINSKVEYSDWLGNTEVKDFELLKKGYYDFTFTASKAGEKSLYERVRVRVGDYVDGEIFNVTDKDAPNRISTMGMSGTIETVDGREIGGTKNERYLKIPYSLSSAYLMSTAYVNFAPSATTEDVNDWKYDNVNVGFYVKSTLLDGVTDTPVITLTFLGVKFQLTLNAYNELSVPSSAFMSRYYRLSETATWADMAFSVNVKTENGFKATFSELALYMSNVTADCSELPENLVIVDETQTVINNADLTATYMTAEEWKEAGILGAYEGNAVAYTVSTNNHGFRVRNDLSRRQMTEFLETYDYVNIWIAVDGGGNDSIVLLTQGLIGESQEANANKQYSFSGSKGNFKTWTKLTISAEDYVNFAIGQANVKLFGIYDEVDTERTYYIGDITYGKTLSESDNDNLGSDETWQ